MSLSINTSRSSPPAAEFEFKKRQTTVFRRYYKGGALSMRMNWKQKFFLPMILLPYFTDQTMESRRYRRYELVLALQRHFSSGCVVWQLLEEYDYDLQRNWNILQLQKVLFKNNVLSALVHPRVRNTTILACPRNKPLYVIQCSDITERQGLQQLFSSLHPSEAHWLLFMDNTSISTEDLLKDIDIPFDCEFLVAVESREAIELKELYRIHYTLPLVWSHWGSWNSGNGLRGPALSLLRRRNDLRGIDFIVAGTHNTPLEHLGKEDAEGNVEASGYSGGLWTDLSKRLNFSLIARRSSDNTYGLQLPNGSWNGIIGMILDGTANASLSKFFITTERSNVVDFTDTVFLLSTDVYIRTRYNSDNSWGIYLAPFTLSLWLSVAGCVLITTCFVWIMHHHQPVKDVYNLQETFFSVLGGFCSQGIAVLPQQPSLRLAMCLTLFTGLVVLGSYGARITSSLAVKIPTLPFRGFEGLLRDDSYEFGVFGKGGFSEMFKLSPGIRRDLFDQKLSPNVHNLPMSHEEGFRRVCNQKYAYFCARVSVVPGIAPCKLTRLPEASNWLYTAFVLRKRSPYRRIINYTLSRMMAAGIHRKLQLQWLVFTDSREPPELKSVHLSDVRAPLCICLVGALISVFVLLVEILMRMKK